MNGRAAFIKDKCANGWVGDPPPSGESGVVF